MASPATIPIAMDENSRSPSAGSPRPEVSDNAQRSYDRHPADARERAGPGEAFTGGAGDRERREPLAAVTEPGNIRTVRHQDRTVHCSGHGGDRIDVGGVNRCRVVEAVFGAHREIDCGVDVLDPHHRHHRHHLFGPHQAVVGRHLGNEQSDIAVGAHTDLPQQIGGVLADPYGVDHPGFVRCPHLLEDHPLEATELVLLEPIPPGGR